MQIKIKQVKFLLSYLEKIKLGIPAVLDFRNDELISRVHPQSKEFVKMVKIPSDNVYELDKTPENFSQLKFPIISINTMIDQLKLFSNNGYDEVVGKFTTEESFEESDMKGSFVAKVLQLKSLDGKMKQRIGTNEVYSYMNDTIWNKFMSKEDKLVSADISDTMIKNLLEFLRIDLKSENSAKDDSITTKISIAESDKSLLFSSESDNKWNYKITIEDGNILIKDGLGDSLIYYIPKKILQMLSSPLYKFEIVKNEDFSATILILTENDSNIIISAITAQKPVD